MKKLIVLSVTMMITQLSFASTPSCKDLLKSSLQLHRLSVQNISAVKGNLKLEAGLISQWVTQIDRATRNGSFINTTGMKGNARELLKQSSTLEEFENSMERELKLITEAAMDCE